MEPRFGHDFSHVRVHTDAKAAESARAVNALAYTVGDHIVFSEKMYAPDAGIGRQLLAHELAHTLQQIQVHRRLPRDLQVSSAGDRFETTASQIAKHVTTDRISSKKSLSHPPIQAETSAADRLYRAPVPGPPPVGSAPHSSFAGAKATVTPTGKIPGHDWDGQYPFQVEVTGIQSDCGALKWEQFIGGTETILDDKGTITKINVCDYIRKNINPSSRIFDGLCDDLVEAGDQPGPKPVNVKTASYATCNGTAPNVTYTNKDAPGIPVDFNTKIPPHVAPNMANFVRIVYDLTFEHKLWVTGEAASLSKRFSLTGAFSRGGSDNRKIK
jgi:hypothetical protein